MKNRSIAAARDLPIAPSNRTRKACRSLIMRERAIEIHTAFPTVLSLPYAKNDPKM